MRYMILPLLFLIACQNNSPFFEGKHLYGVHCANCHGEAGVGLGALIPPLAGSDYLQINRSGLPCLLKAGLKDTIIVNGVTYEGQPMPANGLLSDIQITNILNYIGNSWGNQLPNFRLDEVQQGLKSCK